MCWEPKIARTQGLGFESFRVEGLQGFRIQVMGQVQGLAFCFWGSGFWGVV